MTSTQTCARCGYARQGLSDHSPCPECGLANRTASVRFDGNTDLIAVLLRFFSLFITLSLPNIVIFSLFSSRVVELTPASFPLVITWFFTVIFCAVLFFTISKKIANFATDGSALHGKVRLEIVKVFGGFFMILLAVEFFAVLALLGMVSPV